MQVFCLNIEHRKVRHFQSVALCLKDEMVQNYESLQQLCQKRGRDQIRGSLASA